MREAFGRHAGGGRVAQSVWIFARVSIARRDDRGVLWCAVGKTKSDALSVIGDACGARGGARLG